MSLRNSPRLTSPWRTSPPVWIPALLCTPLRSSQRVFFTHVGFLICKMGLIITTLEVVCVNKVRLGMSGTAQHGTCAQGGLGKQLLRFSPFFPWDLLLRFPGDATAHPHILTFGELMTCLRSWVDFLVLYEAEIIWTTIQTLHLVCIRS